MKPQKAAKNQNHNPQKPREAKKAKSRTRPYKSRTKAVKNATNKSQVSVIVTYRKKYGFCM